MLRAAIILEAPALPDRFFRAQLKQTLRLCRHNFGLQKLSIVVLTRIPISATLRELCLPQVRIMRVFPGYFLPWSLPRDYERLIFIAERTLPALADLIYLLNTQLPIQVIEAGPANALRWTFHAFSPYGQGLVGMDSQALRRMAPKPKKLFKFTKDYVRYSLTERVCLTAWARGMEFQIIEGVSRRFAPAAIWQSWRELAKLVYNLKNHRPLPSLTIRPQHFRLLASQFACLLSLSFVGEGWLYLYLLLAFLCSYDYFFPKKITWQDNLLVLPLKLLYLPFA